MRRILTLLLALPSVLAAQGVAVDQSTARPISLDDAVRLAQRNAPQTIQARGNVRSSAAAVTQAKSAFIPSLSVSLNGSKQGGDRFNPQGELVPFTGAAWSYGSGMNMSLDLFDGFRRMYDLKSANRTLDAAESNETLQQYNVALSVKQQFFNVLAARESEAAARAQLEQAEQQLRAAIARVSAGAATLSDSLRSEIQVGNAQLQLLTAANQLNIANASLTRLVATPYVVTAAADDDESYTVALDSAQIAELVSNGPQVAQARAQLSAADASVKASRASYLPTISMSFRRSGSGVDERFGWGGDRYSYSENLGVSLSLPIFNQWSREATHVRAQVAATNARASLRDAQFLATQNLVQYLGNLKTAEQRIRIQLASVAAAEEDLRVQQQRYSLGASTLLDLLTSQTALDSARQALIQARLDARVAKAQIEALVGRDL